MPMGITSNACSNCKYCILPVTATITYIQLQTGAEGLYTIFSVISTFPMYFYMTVTCSISLQFDIQLTLNKVSKNVNDVHNQNSSIFLYNVKVLLFL
jgi:hypothetical protein